MLSKRTFLLLKLSQNNGNTDFSACSWINGQLSLCRHVWSHCTEPASRGENYLQKITGGFLYNIGRTLMYGVMGAFFGLIGKGFSMAGFQRWISIIMGALMILSVLLPSIFRKVRIYKY